MINQRIALSIMRLQPLHQGHCNLINTMIQNHTTVILCIGSAQKSREKWDPYTFEERKQMVQNVYGDRLKIVQLNDLGTVDGTDDWVDYVLNKIKKIGLPDPTDYFTGSLADAKWYINRFWSDSTGWGPSREDHYTACNGLRRLHIRDRNANPVPAATELRTFLELRSNDWQEWVPRVNWDIVENNFPEGFRVKR